MKTTPILAAVRKLLRTQGRATVDEIVDRSGVPRAQVVQVLEENRPLCDYDGGNIIGLTGLTGAHAERFEATGEPSLDADHWKE